MNPTSKPLSITLGDNKSYQLLFDLNTFSKYEEVTGVPFTEFLAGLHDAVQLAAKGAKGSEMDVLRHIRISDVKAFLHAALHTYDAQDEPVWPFTPGQLGRLVNIENLPRIINTLMTGHQSNLPDVEEMPVRAGGAQPRPFVVDTTPGNGGGESGSSDEALLGSLTLKSAG